MPKTYTLKYKNYKFLIDIEDKILLQNMNIDLCKNKDHIYLRLRKRSKGKILRILFHRLVTKCPNNKQVDHINGNTFDNRKSNLRICFLRENTRNRKSTKNRLLPKGVKKSGKKFSAKVCSNYKCYYLGTFETIKLAKTAYNKKAKELFGEFYNAEK